MLSAWTARRTINEGSIKKIWATGIVCLALALVIFGVYQAWRQPFPVIDSARVVEIKDYGGYPTTLSPDGSKAFNSMTIYYDLKDGSPQANTAAFDAGAPGANEFLSMSPNGRFMTAEHYLIDLEQKTYRDDAFACKSWSKDSMRCIDINGDLIDVLKNQKVEGWNDNVDFTKVKNTSGNGDYLWDNDRNIPIAYINPCPIQNDQTGETLDTQCKLKTPSLDFHQNKEGRSEALLEVSMPSSVVGWTFDPTGRYVLLAIWDRKPGDYTKYEDYTSPQNVVDTRFILIDWRTKKNVELARLSEFVPNNPVFGGFFVTIPWSSDGSTVMIPISGYQALILKIKYP